MNSQLKAFFVFVYFTVFSISFAQENIYQSLSRLKCPYTFNNALITGRTSEEVRLLQKILNANVRTQIYPSGPGSQGQETNYFGAGTRNAVRTFQTLYLENLTFNDGVVSGPTLDFINRLCNKYSQIIEEPENKSNNPLGTVLASQIQINLSTEILNFQINESFKVYLYSNQVLKTPSKSCFISDGATINEIRKLSPNNFVLVVFPSDGARNIFIQVSADCLEDLAGNRNNTASNEIKINSLIPVISTTSSSNSTSTSVAQDMQDYFSNLLDSILSTNGKKTFTGSFNTPTNTSNNVAQNNSFNGQSGPNSGNGDSNSESSTQQNSQSQLVDGILKGLTKSETADIYKKTAPDLEEPNVTPEPNDSSINIPTNIPEICKRNYGFIITGSCSTKNLKSVSVNQKLASAGMTYCAQVGRPISVTSLYRTSECNRNVGGVGNSRHLSGAGVDVPPGSAFGLYLQSKGFKKLDEGNHWHFSAY